ncbi:MAG: hypothetical protein DRQ78_04090, partial [Epsilonproteobacteria bacterium]
MSDLLFQTNYNPDPYMNAFADQAKSIKIYNTKNPTFSFFTTRTIPWTSGKRPFDNGEYDLYETGRIIDTESLVMRAFNKKNTLMFRDGYEIKSKNEENLKYIKRRIAEIEYVSGKKFDDMLREYAYNLVAFHNPYIVKVRKEEASTGEVRKYKGKKNLKPVAAYYCLAPETVEKRLNDAGDATRYRQYMGMSGKYREFAEHNIIYTPFNKRSGFTMGTPPLESTKEDILALRRIEESVETLIYKSLFPIIHLKVGTDKVPAKTLPNGQSEVDVATQLLENIDDNGGIATSERIDITAIGAESLALRVESYLDYFKKRVFAGLGMSAIDFGDGDTTGRATGEVLSASLKDSVVTYQVIIKNMVTDEIFTELLLESGRYKFPFQIEEDDRVYLDFNTVDTDEKIKVESHALNKATQGVITTDELREEIGMPPAPELSEMHSVKLAEESMRQSMELAAHAAKIAPKPAAGGTSTAKKTTTTTTKKTKSGNTKTKNSKQGGGSNSAKAKTAPKNQHSSSQQLARNLTIYATTINDMNLILTKINRELSDHAMLTASHGLIDGKDFIPEDISSEINIQVESLFDYLSNNSKSFSEIEFKI